MFPSRKLNSVQLFILFLDILILKLELDDHTKYQFYSQVSSIIEAQGHIPLSFLPGDATRYNTFGIVNI